MEAAHRDRRLLLLPPAGGHGALTMDHLVPLGRGGTSVRGNVVPACKDCNKRKKAMLPVEWQEYLDRSDTVLDE